MPTVAASVAHFRETGEGLFEVEVVLVSFVRQLVEFRFVCLEMLDKVYKVARLFELLQVLCVDNVAQFVLNPDHKLDCVKGIKSVVSEFAIKVHACFFCCTEVILDNGQHVTLDLVAGLQYKSVFG